VAISGPDQNQLEIIPKQRKRHLWVPAIVLTVVFGVGSYGYWRIRTIGTLVPCLKTGWSDRGEVIVRSDSDGVGTLLLSLIPASEASSPLFSPGVIGTWF